MRSRSRLPACLLAISLVLLVSVPLASAHEHRKLTIAGRQVEFVVGWVVEPPYVDEVNGIDFHATLADSVGPVYGLDQALQVDVSTGGQHTTLALSPVLTDDVPPQFFGGYTTNIIPTVAGDYTFRFFGNVNGTAVDETFKCGPTTFECVDAQADIQFPEKTPSGRLIQVSLQDMQTQLSQFSDAVKYAYVIGASGAILGIAGLAVGVIAIRRKTKAR